MRFGLSPERSNNNNVLLETLLLLLSKRLKGRNDLRRSLGKLFDNVGPSDHEISVAKLVFMFSESGVCWQQQQQQQNPYEHTHYNT